jgi:hypothetical protein
MSSASSSPVFTHDVQFLIEEIVQEFADWWPHVDTIVSTAIAVSQSVMHTLIDGSGNQIDVVVAILQKMVEKYPIAFRNPEETAQLNQIINKVIPQVLAALVQVEQGCIVLCNDIEEAVEEYTWCCRKKTMTGTLSKLPLQISKTSTQKLSTKSNGSTVPVPTQPITVSDSPSKIRALRLSNAVGNVINWKPKTQAPSLAQDHSASDKTPVMVASEATSN